MKRTFINCLAILLFVAPAAVARVALIPLEALLKKTDVIVVARLTDVRETTKERLDHGSGVLTVTELIGGNAKVGDKLRLEWSNESEVICPRVEHASFKDQTVIWLLQTSTNGTVRADHPGRVLDPKSRGELDALLKKK
jgi:hypothetical protein